MASAVRAASQRLDRFISSHGDDLLLVTKSTRNHILDLVWNSQSRRARIELQDAIASRRAARSAASKRGARTRLVEPIVKAYQAVSTSQPVDFNAVRKNVSANEDPQLSKLVRKYGHDPQRLGHELKYRAASVGRHAQFISGAFYHGRAS